MITVNIYEQLVIEKKQLTLENSLLKNKVKEQETIIEQLKSQLMKAMSGEVGE